MRTLLDVRGIVKTTTLPLSRTVERTHGTCTSLVSGSADPQTADAFLERPAAAPSGFPRVTCLFVCGPVYVTLTRASVFCRQMGSQLHVSPSGESASLKLPPYVIRTSTLNADNGRPLLEVVFYASPGARQGNEGSWECKRGAYRVSSKLSNTEDRRRARLPSQVYCVLLSAEKLVVQ